MNRASDEKRLAVDLPGQISVTPERRIPCEIVEVGLEEVVVSLAAPDATLGVGQLVSLRFALPAEAPNPCEAPVQVDSISGNKVRLTFEVPDQDVVVKLNDWAFEQQETKASRFDPRRASDVFEKCCGLAVRFFEDRLPQVPETAKETLFERAHNASSNSQQAESFDAMQEAERIMPSVTRGFFDHFGHGVKRFWSGEPEEDLTDQRGSPKELTLVDTGSFNDWLLTVQIVDRARRTERDAEKELSLRLSGLRREPEEETPFGLAPVCSTFHDGLQKLGAAQATRQALLIAFEMTIVKELDQLHQALNSLLENAGVSIGEAIPGGVQTTRPTGVPAEEAAPSAAQTVRPVPQAPPASTPAAPPPVDQGHDAFRTVQTLIQLGRSPAAYAEAEPSSLARSPLPNAVLEALADLDEGEAESELAVDALPLTRRARDHLSSVDVHPDEATNDVLDLVSDLLEAMLGDPLLHTEVISALRRLSLSLSRTALAGDPFFTELTHPARQLLDSLALIRPRGNHSSKTWDRIDAALVPIIHTAVPTRREYASALSAISPIAERQTAALKQRIESVVNQFETQQAVVESLQSHTEASSHDPDDEGNPPLALKVWLARVDQLCPHDVVLFEPNGGENQPATLAWKADDGMTFAFADHDSDAPLSFTRQQLAMEMRRGEMRKIEGGSLGLTERALCRQLYALHRQVQQKATHDPLTGLVNRKHFESRVRSSLSTASDSFDPDHLALVQVDDFASIHRGCGKRSSRILLRKLAEMLSRQVGEAGLVCRIKGHRFGILVNSGDRDDVVNLMKRYRRSVEEARCVFKGKPFPFTVSIGLIALGQELDTSSDAMTTAESMLTMAMEEGGNRLQIQASEAKIDLAAPAGEPNVTELIRSNALALRAQRVEPLTEGLLPYYEILLGIRKPDGSLAPPGRVITAAEQSGQIGQLDGWVLRTAMTWMMGAPERRQGLSGYAMNLSGITLSDEALLPYVVNCIEETGVPADQVIFEVTETAGIDSLSVAQRFVHELRSLGCRFSLDDFGVGNALCMNSAASAAVSHSMISE